MCKIISKLFFSPPLSSEWICCGSSSGTSCRGEHAHVCLHFHTHLVKQNYSGWNRKIIKTDCSHPTALLKHETCRASFSGGSVTSTLWPSLPNCCSRDSASTGSSSWTGSVSGLMQSLLSLFSSLFLLPKDTALICF